jgi:FAD/FMN-containing dehydrogenase
MQIIGQTLERRMTDWQQFAAELGDIPSITERALVKQKSRDFYWYSPILKALLDSKSADIIVCPRNEAEVIATAALCARYRVPLTVRGGGTGNYGQAVPLAGGVVLEMTALDRIIALEAGLLTVQVGKKLADIDAETTPMGWELRMHPSTKRTATIGGFIAGGSAGVGSITWGGLRDPGNVVSARVISCEETPRVITLTGTEVAGVNHGYGTTGIITELTVAMAPVQPWMDIVAVFDHFDDAAGCALAVGEAPGIAKKLLTVVASPLPGYFRGLDIPAGKHVLLAMISAAALVPWAEVLKRYEGEPLSCVASDDLSEGRLPIYEYAWNHTTLNVLRTDKSVTYLQCLFPANGALDLVGEMRAAFGDEVLMHLEFLRIGGRVTCSALPVVRYSTEARINEIIAFYEARGVSVANPHVVTLEDGAGHKKVGDGQPAMKARMDPYALLNPGKMRTYQPGNT